MFKFTRIFSGNFTKTVTVVSIVGVFFSAITSAQAVVLDPIVIESVAKAIAEAGVKQEVDQDFLRYELSDLIDKIVQQANGKPQARIRRWIQCWGDGSIHIVAFPDGGGPGDRISDTTVAGPGSCSGKFWSYEIT